MKKLLNLRFSAILLSSPPALRSVSHYVHSIHAGGDRREPEVSGVRRAETNGTVRELPTCGPLLSSLPFV